MTSLNLLSCMFALCAAPLLAAADTPDGAIDGSWGSSFGRSVVTAFPLGVTAFNSGAAALSPFGRVWMFGDPRTTQRLILSTRLMAGTGQPDPAYGTAGSESTNLPMDYTLPRVTGAVVMPDGKPVVLGRAQSTDPNVSTGFACRLTASGSLDQSFAVGGCRRLRSFAFTQESCTATAAIVDASGRLLVIGDCFAQNAASRRTFLARLTASGAFDPEFAGGAGLIVPTFPGLNVEVHGLAGVAVRPDGRIVLAGTVLRSTGDYDLALMQYDDGGSLDLSFNGGIVLRVVDLGGADNDYAGGLALRPDGRAVVSALAELPGEDGAALLWQVNPSGATDAAFAQTGISVVQPALSGAFINLDPLSGPRQPVRVALDGDKAVLLGLQGHPEHALDQDLDHRVFRMLRNGQLDPGFGPNQSGWVDIDNSVAIAGTGPSDDQPLGAPLLTPGGIVIGSQSIRRQSQQTFMISYRLVADHLLRNGFEN